MEFDQEFWVTLLFTFINVVVLFLILKKLLFKPVTNFMDERSKRIEEALNSAEEAKKQMDNIKKEYDVKLKMAKIEGDKILKDYRKKADKEYNEIIENAKKEADLIIEKGRTELKIEKEEFISELKKDFSNLVLIACQKVLNKNIDNDTNKELINEFINNQEL